MSPHMPICGFSNQIYQRIVKNSDGFLCGNPNWMGSKEQIFLRGEGTSASRGSLIFVREILSITGITIKETGEPGKGARFEMTVPNGAYRMNAETNDIQGGGT